MKVEILKKLVLDRENIAKFSHYIAGNLYYEITVDDGTYQFPIETIEKNEDETISLSSDLGTTEFEAEYKAATMMRYIRKAIKNETLIKIA